MNPNKQSIAIAEVCGLILVQSPYHSVWGHTTDGKTFCDLPNYLNDKNAIGSVLDILDNSQYTKEFSSNPNDYGWTRYESELRKILKIDLEEHYEEWEGTSLRCYHYSQDAIRKMMQATAAQQCEAFLKAIYKWKDEK